MKISVVLTFKDEQRAIDIYKIVQGWINAGADEIILCDCCPTPKHPHYYYKSEDKSKVFYVRFEHDFGNVCRSCLALLTTGYYIIFADDDVLPKKKLIEDMIGWKESIGADFVGLIGRKLDNPNYLKSSFFAANKISNPEEVAFVGVCVLTERRFLDYNMRPLINHSNLNDIYWQCGEFPNASKWVIPTLEYENLPTCMSNTALCHDKNTLKERFKAWEEYYEANHKG